VIRLAVSLISCAVLALATAPPPASIDQATVPLIVEANRPFVELSFRRGNATVRTARFLIDSGGGDFIVAEPLARDLGLAWGKVVRQEGSDLASVTTPVEASVGGLALDLNPDRIAVVMGGDNVLPPAATAHAEGILPGHVLAKYHVIFDFPRLSFTLARPGVLHPQGRPMAMPVQKRSGFPRTEVTVDGVTYGFLLDTGASFTMVSEARLKAWGARHADWPRHAGAFGDAVLLGGATLETMFVPRAQWGVETLTDWGLVSQPEGTFERFMSSMTKGAVVGSLATNVLKAFRLELDYANEKLYVSRP
jgi:hypothetical protein